MTLNRLIELLKQADPQHTCKKGFRNPHSYRGYYERLAFEPASNVQVHEMLYLAEDALGDTFSGYKGGEYFMHGDVEVHIAFYGQTDQKHYDAEGLTEQELLDMLNDYEAK